MPSLATARSGREAAGAGAGLPRFLAHMKIAPSLRANPSNDTHEQEADGGAAQPRAKVRPGSAVTGTLDEGTLGARLVRQRLDAMASDGAPLPSPTREAMEVKFGADFSGVRVHADAGAGHVAGMLGANALTTGRDIYFGASRYDPASPEGERLLGHELSHVIQQGSAAKGPIQCDLAMTLPTALGWFDMNMIARTTPAKPGLDGHIRFEPEASGPYSTEIGLIQVVDVTNVGGATPAPFDWSGGPEAARNTLGTTGLDGAPPGWFVDAQTAANPQSSAVGPNYLEQWGASPGHNEFGWLRSPTDVHAASLYDYPGGAGWEIDFDFETVAKATDTQAVYGALWWGFGLRSNAVVNEYAYAAAAQSATFEEALERFRGYYTHEPIVLYFDTDKDSPLAGEEAKIAAVLDYLGRYPDVMIRIDGYADERGGLTHNEDLAQRRAGTVESMTLAMGVTPSRIDYAVGWGPTASFSAGSPPRNPGSLRANRRVVMSFFRTASSQIVMP